MRYITTVEIAQYLHNELLMRGYIPTEEEVIVISDILFDFLCDLGAIEEDDDDY
jgi:hypothetical protein